MCSEIKVCKVTESNDGGSLIANLEIPDQLLNLPELLGKIPSSTGQSLHVWSWLLLLLFLLRRCINMVIVDWPSATTLSGTPILTINKICFGTWNKSTSIKSRKQLHSFLHIYLCRKCSWWHDRATTGVWNTSGSDPSWSSGRHSPLSIVQFYLQAWDFAGHDDLDFYLCKNKTCLGTKSILLCQK